MANALEIYMEGSAGGLWNWTPAIVPSQVKKYAGFAMGGNSTSDQSSPLDFTTQTMKLAWESVPPEASAFIRDGIQNVLSAISVSNSVTGVLNAAIPAISGMVAMAGAAQKMAEFVVQYIQGTMDENDTRRYDSRLGIVENLEDAGPAHWAGQNSYRPYYYRKRPLQKQLHTMSWPPDDTGKVFGGDGYENIGFSPKAGDCRALGADMCPKFEDCEGTISLYPLFMPLWSQRALGAYGPMVSMRGGMERAHKGGTRIWEKMIQMQTGLLTDPILNLLCNGEDLKWFSAGCFDRFHNAIGPNGSNILETIDNEFVPGKRIGYYRTPGNLFAAYSPLATGGGSTAHDLLKGPVAGTFMSSGVSDYNGTGVSFANMNTIASTTAQFFALRKATLHDRSICEYIVKQRPEILARIPESKVRAAIEYVGNGGMITHSMQVVNLGAQNNAGGTMGATAIFSPASRYTASAGNSSSAGPAGGKGVLLLGAAAVAIMAMRKK